MIKQTTNNNVSLKTNQNNIAIMGHHGEQQEQHENILTNETISKYSFFISIEKKEIE